MQVKVASLTSEYAVMELEDRQLVQLPRQLLPAGAKEGDIVSIELKAGPAPKRKRRLFDFSSEPWQE